LNSAIGCATPSAPYNGWVERGTGDTAIVGCNFTRQRWYLHCAGRQWVGDSRNCTVLNDVGLYAPLQLSRDFERGRMGDLGVKRSAGFRNGAPDGG